MVIRRSSVRNVEFGSSRRRVQSARMSKITNGGLTLSGTYRILYTSCAHVAAVGAKRVVVKYRINSLKSVYVGESYRGFTFTATLSCFFAADVEYFTEKYSLTVN